MLRRGIVTRSQSTGRSGFGPETCRMPIRSGRGRSWPGDTEELWKPSWVSSHSVGPIVMPLKGLSLGTRPARTHTRSRSDFDCFCIYLKLLTLQALLLLAMTCVVCFSSIRQSGTWRNFPYAIPLNSLVLAQCRQTWRVSGLFRTSVMISEQRSNLFVCRACTTSRRTGEVEPFSEVLPEILMHV